MHCYSPMEKLDIHLQSSCHAVIYAADNMGKLENLTCPLVLTVCALENASLPACFMFSELTEAKNATWMQSLDR